MRLPAYPSRYPLTRSLLLVVTVSALVLASAVACSGTRIRSGQVGVRVVDIGAHAGVQQRELGVGWYFPQLGSYVLKFPTTVRTEVWSSAERADGPPITFNNADGVAANASISIQLRIDPERASDAVQRYRLGFEDMVQGPVRRRVQDAFNRVGPRYSSDDLVTGRGGQLLNEVLNTIRAPLEREGVVVENLALAGPFGLPLDIIEQINSRVRAEREAATQEAQVRVVRAQAQQRVAEAEGLARATQIEGDALRANPQILRMREIERWNGQCPLDGVTCVIGAGAVIPTPTR